MKLEIITAEKEIFNGEVSSVKLPGVSGSFELLNQHAPIISTLSNGTIRIIKSDNSVVNFEISGGVIELQNNKIIVLAG